jgi:dephospho-CoA kinase
MSGSAADARPARPYSIGLTGGIGSGKSTVAERFAARGAAVVDTDAIAHALTGPDGRAMPAIAERFGAGCVRADGSLDRDAMRQRVFADPAQRAALEAILHPLIRAEATRQIAAARAPYVLVAIPLLAERDGWRDRLDRVLVVDCSRDRQVERVIQRSRLSREQVTAILAAQAGREQRLALADDVLDNDGAPEALEPQVDRLHRQYLALAARARPARVGE